MRFWAENRRTWVYYSKKLMHIVLCKVNLNFSVLTFFDMLKFLNSDSPDNDKCELFEQSV